MKPSHAESSPLISRTHKVWQSRLSRKLTDEDARQIAENVTGFFTILAEWASDAKENPATAADGLTASGRAFRRVSG